MTDTQQVATSKRRRSRDQRVKRLRRQLLAVAPTLNDPKFAPLVSSFARITLLGVDSYEFLREKGLIGENGELRSSVDAVNRLIGTQLKLATALGLTPAVLGKLRNEPPDDLAAAMARHVDDAEVVSSDGDGSR